MSEKRVVIDAQTIAGNRWLNKFLDSNATIGVPSVVNDADGGAAYYISQLASLETTVYEVPYADITYLEDVPVLANIPEYATHWNYRSYDGAAMGKFISANASDLPRVAQSAKLHQVELGYAGVECHYSLDELRTTAAVNMPIDSMQAELAFRGSEEHSQRVAYFGDTNRNMSGLLNNPNVTKTSATVNYATCTGQELFDLLNNPVFAVVKASKRFHTPNTVLMFPDLWKRASSLLMTGYTDRTVIEHFQINNAYTLLTRNPIDIKIRFQLMATELAAAGVSNGNKDRYVVYDKSERNLALAKPIPFRMLAPQLLGLGITVPAEYKISGTEYRYPLCAQYVDML
ncbi:gp29 major capsid protein [Iodobacter phage PhiPLPE]|uniref:Gp29 major capsid protein n=1 Tax=Iodobacter phage PhiPLPE TaxID=551895 RepID=B5AX48_9CAUD|nr:major head protein [Iodobacter phage PhiPLPE]ACG60351.1 gp29 major capsid protein [Iodobacter phage PhiPLPE]